MPAGRRSRYDWIWHEKDIPPGIGTSAECQGYHQGTVGILQRQMRKEIKGAVVGFMVLLCKRLMDDDRWDWDVEKCDYKACNWGFSEPTVLRTTISVFMNT